MSAQRKFWEKKSDVISEDMWRIWNAGFKAIQRYVKELEERVNFDDIVDNSIAEEIMKQ